MMAEERIGTADGESRARWAWTDLFRTFWVALDPKKLALAAAGIFFMWVGWWAVSAIFFNSRAEPKPSDYDTSYYQKKYDLPEAAAAERAKDEFDRDQADYMRFRALAEPGGLLRVPPWDEDRGPNPFMLVTGQLHDPNWRGGRTAVDWLFTQQVPVLIEPLVKFLRPIGLLLNPHLGGVTRLYLLAVTLWTLAVWAFFGGAITRLAVVQLAGKDRPGFMETLRFIASRFLSYFAAPLVPLIFVALLVVLFVVYGLVLHIWPLVGDVIDGIVFPILVLLGFAQAILLVGLVGYPLMYATVSSEGSDTFDALSRSYNYVFQSPWAYIWYSFVAVIYGAVLVFFVVFMGSFVVYLTKWSLGQTPLAGSWLPSRSVDNLFYSAPESFHWRELLVTGPVKLTWYSQVGAVLVSVWVTIIFLLMIGFAYSYYFSAFSMVYLLMRRKVDDTEIDEVYLEEDEPEEPLLPPSPAADAAGSPGTSQPLQMVDAPALRTPTGDGSASGPAPAQARPPENPPVV
jgi:hypothetical protein